MYRSIVMLVVWSVAAVLWVGCPSDIQLNNNYRPDAAWTCECDLYGDEDQDGILNHHEGCMYCTDTDDDGIADFVDFDSDNDGIPDELEAGDSMINSPPTDFDGDGITTEFQQSYQAAAKVLQGSDVRKSGKVVLRGGLQHPDRRRRRLLRHLAQPGHRDRLPDSCDVACPIDRRQHVHGT